MSCCTYENSIFVVKWLLLFDSLLFLIVIISLILYHTCCKSDLHFLIIIYIGLFIIANVVLIGLYYLSFEIYFNILECCENKEQQQLANINIDVQEVVV